MPNQFVLFPITIFLVIQTKLAHASEFTTSELLGFERNAKLLIINADDYGMSLSTNKGVENVLKNGVATGATIMMPCPWSLAAVMHCKSLNLTNIGIHVTLNAEYSRYKWKGLTTVEGNSLLGADGYLYNNIFETGSKGKIEDIKREIHAQIKAALDYGIDLSHFDSHMASLYGINPIRLEILALSFALAYEFGLPWRIPFIPYLLTEFKRLGFVFIDSLLAGNEPNEREARKQYWIRTIKLLQPGITEILFHPALIDDELRAIMSETGAKARQYDHDILLDPEIKQLIRTEGAPHHTPH
jgi:predicted glycoside hydrolase/deacetylase ChbG (UPF0249 family)